MKQLIAFDDYVSKFETLAAAARDLGVSYMTAWRWQKRRKFSPESSPWRLMARIKGVELPSKP